MTVKHALILILVMILSLVIGTMAVAFVIPQRNGWSAAAKPALITGGAIENAAALNHFFRELTAGQPVRAMHFGDSHTKADIFTGEIRRNLQRDFGDGTRHTKTTALSVSDRRSPSVGVRYDAFGINGARAKRLRGMVETPAFIQSVAVSHPDLIVLAYGSNEVTDDDWTVDSYERMFSLIINRLRATAPGVSVLVIAPPDRTVQTVRGWVAARRMSELVEAQRRAAFNCGAAFWSAGAAMGGENSMNGWVARGLGQPDHVHLTAAGYIKLGRIFYGDLMTAYRNRNAVDATLDGLEWGVLPSASVSKKSN